MPHRCLAQLYERAKNLPRKAQYHREKADELLAQLKGDGEALGEAAAESG
jgi:hypothetical protein